MRKGGIIVSTREIAISIIDSMTEEELNEFVLRYKSEREQGAKKTNDLSEKRQAFLEIQKMRKKCPMILIIKRNSRNTGMRGTEIECAY